VAFGLGCVAFGGLEEWGLRQGLDIGRAEQPELVQRSLFGFVFGVADDHPAGFAEVREA
jgi:hypothetical protein